MTRLAFSLCLLAGACTPRYQAPGPHEPHAVLKLRLAYHVSSPGPTRREDLRVNGHGIELPRHMHLRGPDQNGTHHTRIHPGYNALAIGATFSHQEMQSRMVTENVRESCGTYQSGTGTFRTTQTRYCNRTRTRMVTRPTTVVDARCDRHTAIEAQPGSTYVLQYDFYGNGRCQLAVYEQIARLRGGFDLRPVPVAAVPPR